jgi:hypothetical protein
MNLNSHQCALVLDGMASADNTVMGDTLKQIATQIRHESHHKVQLQNALLNMLHGVPAVDRDTARFKSTVDFLDEMGVDVSVFR